MTMTGSPWLTTRVTPRSNGKLKAPTPEAPDNIRRKFKPKEIHEIYEEYGRGQSYRQIAMRRGVTHVAIWKIINRKSYRHVPAGVDEVPENVET